MKKITVTLKERWKFYLLGYAFGYLILVLSFGVTSWRSLFPIKLDALGISIVIGALFYYRLTKLSIKDTVKRSIKYVVFLTVLFIIEAVLKLFISKSTGIGIDIFLT